PAGELEEPTGGGERLSPVLVGVEVAAASCAGVDQRCGQVDTEADLFDGGAVGAGGGAVLGVYRDGLRARRQGESDRDSQGGEQAEQRAPGLVPVAEGRAEQPVPDTEPAGQPAPAVQVVLLGDEDAACLGLVAGGPVRGRQVLVRLGGVIQVGSRVAVPAQP